MSENVRSDDGWIRCICVFSAPIGESVTLQLVYQQVFQDGLAVSGLREGKTAGCLRDQIRRTICPQLLGVDN